VVAGGPGEKAGLKVGDTITRLGGDEIRDLTDVAAAIRRVSAGQTVPFEILRNGKAEKIEVRFGRQPGVTGVAQVPMAPDLPAAPKRPPAPLEPPPLGDREKIVALERRVAELERRIAELEKALLDRNAPR
jgi:membrane-associated protease RseP (regulator of RpoE activity)